MFWIPEYAPGGTDSGRSKGAGCGCSPMCDSYKKKAHFVHVTAHHPIKTNVRDIRPVYQRTPPAMEQAKTNETETRLQNASGDSELIAICKELAVNAPEEYVVFDSSICILT